MYRLDFIIDFDDEESAKNLAGNLADIVGQAGIKRVAIHHHQKDKSPRVIEDVGNFFNTGIKVKTDTDIPEGKAYIFPNYKYFDGE